MKELNGIRHTILFILSTTFRSGIFYIVALVMTIISVFLSSVLFPFESSSSFDYFLMVTLPMLITLGWFNYSIRNTNLQRNLGGVSISKLDLYWAEFVSIWVIGTVLTIWYLVSFEAFAQMGILLKGYRFHPKFNLIPEVETIMFSNTLWIPNLIYIYNINILITFSLFYLVHVIIKDERVYYMFILALIILTLIYGGIMNEFFNNPTTFNGEDWYPKFERGIFPEYMFYPSLLFPYFSVNSMFSYGFTLTALESIDWLEHGVSNMVTHGNTFWNLSFKWNEHWTVMFCMPFIWMATCWSIGSYFVQRDEIKDYHN